MSKSYIYILYVCMKVELYVDIILCFFYSLKFNDHINMSFNRKFFIQPWLSLV